MKKQLSEQFIRMQKLAGIITENTRYNELKPLENILLKNGYKFSKDDAGFSGKATYEKKADGSNIYEISLFKDYEEDMGADKGKTFPVRVLYFVADDYTFTNGKKLNRGQADINYISIDDAKKDLEGVSKL